jgi:ABC-type nickel/cobalt efflux system permease component RcnA
VRSRPRLGAALALAALAATGAAIGAPAAAGAAIWAPSAHPLGNFSVNHYHGLRLHPDRIDDLAILDEAEIPTRQNATRVDSDADGNTTAAERSAYAAATCRELTAALQTQANGKTLSWTIRESTFTYQPGAGGLPTGRTQCHLTVAVDLRQANTVSLNDSYRSDRIGWREITAVGDGVTITNAPVPATSVSDELRRYPNDVLASPLNQRSVELRTTPGRAGVAAAARTTIPIAGPIARAIETLTSHFNSLAATPHLTPLIGLLAICLALLLGAAHAALPGHGKTVMAAYIAGKRGTIRDAVTVGVTVTTTHTAGVLALGLTLTLAASLAGETLLGWLGVTSGLLIAAIGASLLRSARPTASRRNNAPDVEAPEHIHLSAHALPASAAIGSHTPPVATTDPNPHEHHQHHPDGEHHHGHIHNHGHHHAEHARQPFSSRGLVGLGVAGGLVPSPSALVVLLGAIALGRTWFGVLLVIAYGAGMSATLTAAGLLLVHLRNRLDPTASGHASRWSRIWTSAAPLLTAGLVLLVGLGLAVRSALPLLGG